VLDLFFINEGILPYHPNANYDGLRVSKHWAGFSDKGKAKLNDGVITLQSDNPGYGIYTPFIPSVIIT